MLACMSNTATVCRVTLMYILPDTFSTSIVEALRLPDPAVCTYIQSTSSQLAVYGKVSVRLKAWIVGTMSGMNEWVVGRW